MERQTITYNGSRYHRYPASPRRQLRVYYWKHDRNKAAPVSLHRQLYEDAHGPIPPGHSIHHVDHDPLNNDIGNLACMPSGKHMSQHMREPGRVAASRQNIKKANEASKAWHRSPEGRAWHREHAARTIPLAIAARKKR